MGTCRGHGTASLLPERDPGGSPGPGPRNRPTSQMLQTAETPLMAATPGTWDPHSRMIYTTALKSTSPKCFRHGIWQGFLPTEVSAFNAGHFWCYGRMSRKSLTCYITKCSLSLVLFFFLRNKSHSNCKGTVCSRSRKKSCKTSGVWFMVVESAIYNQMGEINPHIKIICCHWS